jgi:hypothetical protein
MTSTTPQFKPLSLGQILDQAIRIYRKNFFQFIGIIAIVQIPIVLFQLLSSIVMVSGFVNMSDPDNLANANSVTDILGPGYLLGMGSNFILAIVSFVLVQGIATAALSGAIADNYLGSTTSIASAYKNIRDKWGGLLIALILLALFSIVLVFWLIVPCIGWVTGPGLLVFISLGIGQLLAPVVVVERIGGQAAIRRAWELARRRFWWVVGFIVLLFIFGQLLMTGPTLLVSWIGQLFFGMSVDPTSSGFIIQTVIQTAFSLILGIIYLPLQISAMTLFYFDLRVRTEGFDIAMLTYQGMEDKPGLETITAQTTASQVGSILTGTEIGNFVLLSIGVGIIYAIFVSVLMAINLMVLGASGGFPMP